MFDRQMRYMLVSDRWLASYGLGDQNVVGRSPTTSFPICPIVSNKSTSAVWREQLKPAKKIGFPARMAASTGCAGKFTLGEPTPMRLAASDFFGVITERKNAELALTEASQQISNILESITDAFMAIDAQWRYTYVNATAEQLLSRSRADLLGRSIWELFPAEKESNSRTYQEFHRVVNEQVSVKFEEFSPSLQMYIEVSAYPAAEGLTAYWSDISDRKRTEEELRQKNAILNVINESAPTPIFVKNQRRTHYLCKSSHAGNNGETGFGSNWWSRSRFIPSSRTWSHSHGKRSAHYGTAKQKSSKNLTMAFGHFW